MLRVIPSRNAKEYYTQALKREDYYTERQEISGNWQGIGAEKLGLSGPVTTEAFEQLCDSRFKEALTIYTDDKPSLLEAVSKSSARFLAMDLATKQLSVETPIQVEMEKPQQVEQEVPEPAIKPARKKAPRRRPKGIPLWKLH